MAIKVSGMGSNYGLPGLTAVLLILAFWLGTRYSGQVKDIKSPILQHLIAILAIALAFYVGSENSDLFKGVPVLGKVAE